MQKLVSLAFSTLSTFSTTSQAFIQGHFRQTQRRVRREAVHGEPQVVNWEAASLEILQSASGEGGAEGDEACDVEQLIDIKSALEGRAADWIEELGRADARRRGRCRRRTADADDAGGATAEDRAWQVRARPRLRRGLTGPAARLRRPTSSSTR